VPRAGFEPAPSDLKDRCPRPLDERGDVGAGGENRTRIFCLEGSGSAIELRQIRALDWCVTLESMPPAWLRANKMVDGAGIEPAQPKGLDPLASRCLTAGPNHP
jgi:hypothetical protein